MLANYNRQSVLVPRSTGSTPVLSTVSSEVRKVREHPRKSKPRLQGGEMKIFIRLFYIRSANGLLLACLTSTLLSLGRFLPHARNSIPLARSCRYRRTPSVPGMTFKKAIWCESRYLQTSMRPLPTCAQRRFGLGRFEQVSPPLHRRHGSGWCKVSYPRAGGHGECSPHRGPLKLS